MTLLTEPATYENLSELVDRIIAHNSPRAQIYGNDLWEVSTARHLLINLLEDRDIPILSNVFPYLRTDRTCFEFIVRRRPA